MNDVDEFYSVIKSLFISNRILGFLREKIKAKVKHDIEEIENKKKATPSRILMSEEAPQCSIKWPICLGAMQNPRTRKRANSFFAFRATPAQVIHNYFSIEYMQSCSNQDGSKQQSKPPEIELKNYNQRRRTFEFSESKGTLKEKEQIAKVRDSIDPTYIQNSMVIGRHSHICNSRPPSGSLQSIIRDRVQSQTKAEHASILENFLRGSIEDHKTKHNQELRDNIKSKRASTKIQGDVYPDIYFPNVINRLITRSTLTAHSSQPKQNKIQKDQAEDLELTSNVTDIVETLNRRISAEQKYSNSGSTERATAENSRSEHNQNKKEEANDGDTNQLEESKEPTSPRETFQNLGEEDVEEVEVIIEETDKDPDLTAMDTRPRLSILSYLEDDEQLASDLPSDKTSKSTEFLNEYIARNSFA